MTQPTSTAGAASPLNQTEEPPGRGPVAGHALQAGEDNVGRAALALHMELPGTRLDMVLGRPHPLLAELVRHLARAAARADRAADVITSESDLVADNQRNP